MKARFVRMSRVDNDAPDGFEPLCAIGVVVRGRHRLAQAAIENFGGGVDPGGGRDFFIAHDFGQRFKRGCGVSAGQCAQRRGADVRWPLFGPDFVHGVKRRVGVSQGVSGQGCLVIVGFLRRGVSAFPRCRGYPDGPAHRSFFAMRAGGRARRRKRQDGARKMKNPPADCSGRVWVGVENVRSVATQWVGVVLPSGL